MTASRFASRGASCLNRLIRHGRMGNFINSPCFFISAHRAGTFFTAFSRTRRRGSNRPSIGVSMASGINTFRLGFMTI
jgi:hypothetical protein